jgi:sporulation protein YunB
LRSVASRRSGGGWGSNSWGGGSGSNGSGGGSGYTSGSYPGGWNSAGRSNGWRSRPTRAKSRKKIFFIVLLLVALFSMQSFIFVEKNLRDPLMAMAKIRLKQIATEAINSAITTRIAEGADYEKLIDWRTDRDGKVTGFMLNYAEHMRITAETLDTVQKTLNSLTESVESIPLGEALNSAIIASFGPEIPIRLKPEGAVKVDLNTRYQNAGINMILVEVYVHIMDEVMIIVPFDTAPEIVETDIPISYVLVVGDVPTYYFDNKGAPVDGSPVMPPSISIPGIGGGKGVSVPGVKGGTTGRASSSESSSEVSGNPSGRTPVTGIAPRPASVEPGALAGMWGASGLLGVPSVPGEAGVSGMAELAEFSPGVWQSAMRKP